jgi:hypothetical protein
MLLIVVVEEIYLEREELKNDTSRVIVKSLTMSKME